MKITLNTFMDDEDISRKMRSLYIQGNFLSKIVVFTHIVLKVNYFKPFAVISIVVHFGLVTIFFTLNKFRIANNNCLY